MLKREGMVPVPKLETESNLILHLGEERIYRRLMLQPDFSMTSSLFVVFCILSL